MLNYFLNTLLISTYKKMIWDSKVKFLKIISNRFVINNITDRLHVGVLWL